MANGYWMIRTYESGPVGEKIKYWIPGQKPTKSERRMKQDLKKARQNKEQAERHLARLINANFTYGDILLGLDYSGEAYAKRLMPRAEKIKARRAKEGKSEPEAEAEELECIRQAAEHELENFILRVQRDCKKKQDGSKNKQVEFKYIAVTSDMDGKTGEMVRVHHHLLVNREVAEIAKRKWNVGRVVEKTTEEANEEAKKELGGNTNQNHAKSVDVKKLGKQPDYTPIAVYLMQQVRHIPDAKKYKPSRNLVRPQPKDRVALSDAELRLPKGCSMLYRSSYVPGMSQYIRYIIRSRKKDRRNE